MRMSMREQIEALRAENAALKSKPQATASAGSFVQAARKAVAPVKAKAKAKVEPLPRIIEVVRLPEEKGGGLSLHVHNGRSGWQYRGKYLSALILEAIFTDEGLDAAGKVMGRSIP